MGESDNGNNLIKVGSRISCQDQIGTVKYIGEVAGHPGEWLGIDWDDPKRGKHDGTVKNVRYFTTRHPQSGSLVRRNKVETGVEIADAIESRYLITDSDDFKVDKKMLEECQRILKSSTFEVVGIEKLVQQQSNLKHLTYICLINTNISHVNPKKLKEICPYIYELILSSNLISDWTTVSAIVESLPRLECISLSKNIMLIPDDPEKYIHCYTNLKTLILTQCELTFDDVMHLTIMIPRIEILHLSMNNITNLREPNLSIQFGNLRVLDLDENNIIYWSEIIKLGTIDTLENLQLRKTKLKSIFLPKCGIRSKCNIFINLKELNIADNDIDNWKSISELNKLRSLISLQCTNNPVMSDTKYIEAWSQTVPRISNLKMLNRSEILADERRGTEYDLLKQHGMKWIASENDPKLRQEFIDEFNSFPSLIAKYGIPEESLLTTNKPLCLKSKLLTIKICNSHDDKVLVKKLPDKMTVQSLLGLVQKLFDTGNDVPELVYCSPQCPGIEIPLNNVTKTLDYFSLQNNDVITAKW